MHRLAALLAAAVVVTSGAPAPSDRFFTPYRDARRESFESIRARTISFFGDPRVTYVRGHKHSGIDLKGKFEEPVYAIGKGKVVDIHLAFPHLTVVVEHRLPDGSSVWSSYKHVEALKVKVGDAVDQETVIGRLFNRDEHKRSGFPEPHMHFEIRRSIADGGAASWTTMTKEALNDCCVDPTLFFKEHLTARSAAPSR